MSTLADDVQLAAQWAGYGAAILKALAGMPASVPAKSAPAANASLTVGVDPLPELTAGLTTLNTVAGLFKQWDAEMNTPEMVNASVAEKLQAFKDRVNNDLATGNEADLESLEAQ